MFPDRKHHKEKPMRKVTLAPIICSLLTLAACTVGIAQRQEIVGGPSAVPPSAIPTSLPATPVATDTEETSQQTVDIFLIALEDNGVSGKPVGCGDSAVPVQVTIPHTREVLRAALEALLSVEGQFYGESGLYNALYQSDLQVESITIEEGNAIIHLSGTLMLGGMCDNPRVQAQIEETALQFATVNEVTVFLNDRPLEEVLSLKGE
jgi:hypothetical protein